LAPDSVCGGQRHRVARREEVSELDHRAAPAHAMLIVVVLALGVAGSCVVYQATSCRRRAVAVMKHAPPRTAEAARRTARNLGTETACRR
jgi:hypothetical protein